MTIIILIIIIFAFIRGCTKSTQHLAKSDGVGRVSKIAPPTSKRFHLNFQVRRRGCATFPSAARGRTATDDGAAARIYRGTYQGLLAARTSLRGDVEVAHPATFPGYSTLPHRPRAP